MQIPNESLHFVVSCKVPIREKMNDTLTTPFQLPLRHEHELVSSPVRRKSSTGTLVYPELRRVYPEVCRACAGVSRTSILRPSRPCFNSSAHSSNIAVSPTLNRATLSWYHVADFKEPPMEWTTPQHEEIDLNCEI